MKPNNQQLQDELGLSDTQKQPFEDVSPKFILEKQHKGVEGVISHVQEGTIDRNKDISETANEHDKFVDLAAIEVSPKGFKV